MRFWWAGTICLIRTLIGALIGTRGHSPAIAAMPSGPRKIEPFSGNSSRRRHTLAITAQAHGCMAVGIAVRLGLNIGFEPVIPRCIAAPDAGDTKRFIWMTVGKRFSRKMMTATLLLGASAAMAGCSSIRENRGYIVDETLISSVQPGLDNQQSVVATLGRPTFTSQFGDQTWYYVSSVTGRKPFVRPRIRQHMVLAVKFDEGGNVVAADRSGIDQVVYLQPDGDETPTLGRERSFFEDLFGNIGQVGAPGAGGGAGPGG